VALPSSFFSSNYAVTLDCGCGPGAVMALPFSFSQLGLQNPRLFPPGGGDVLGRAIVALMFPFFSTGCRNPEDGAFKPT